MSTIVPHDVMCFGLERAFAKAYGLRTETYKCGPDVYRIAFGLRWHVQLTPEAVSDLYGYVEDPRALKDHFDSQYANTCLAFRSDR